LRSGNNEHPLDRFYNTSVEALPVSTPDASVVKKFKVLPDGFYSIGWSIYLSCLTTKLVFSKILCRIVMSFLTLLVLRVFQGLSTSRVWLRATRRLHWGR
jgi:hypothetical protein